MIQRSRIPAIVMLLVLLGLGGAFMYARSSASASVAADESKLEEQKAAIAQPNAKPNDWLLYANTLEKLKHYSEAAKAYAKYLESFPNNRDARLECCICLAQSNDAEKFYNFMSETVTTDPRLSKDIFENRTEVASYLSQERFQALKKQAEVQSMD